LSIPPEDILRCFGYSRHSLQCFELLVKRQDGLLVCIELCVGDFELLVKQQAWLLVCIELCVGDFELLVKQQAGLLVCIELCVGDFELTEWSLSNLSF